MPHFSRRVFLGGLLGAACLGIPAPLLAQQQLPDEDDDLPIIVRRLLDLEDTFDGRLGVAIVRGDQSFDTNGDDRFSLQSVVKLIVAAATLDAVDRGEFKLDDPVEVRRQDLSVFMQPLADKVPDQGVYRSTVDELIRLAVTASDSAANDILYAKIGGKAAVRKFLDKHDLEEMRVDRDERHLQTDIVGLTWKPEYVDAATLDLAIQAVPKDVREASYASYVKDARDTTTPLEMAHFLDLLSDGKMLKPASTAYLLGVMRDTTTGQDRLKAGLAPGWSVGHKTGTSGSWNGLTAATNDVGILYPPKGEPIIVAVLMADSRLDDKRRAAIFAEVTRIITTSPAPSPK